jgi:predicted nucleotide-binding protein
LALLRALMEERSERSTQASDPRRVAVIHGRNLSARNGMFTFLRALDLAPEEWEEVVAKTRKGSPPMDEIIRELFRDIQAVVVILTPDETATLRPVVGGKGEAEPQSRPNVIFEAGLAWGRYPDRTLFVRMGPHRPISDIAGLYHWEFTGDAESRQRLVGALKTAGCPAKTDNRKDWLRDGSTEFAEALELVRETIPTTMSTVTARDPLQPVYFEEQYGILWDVSGLEAQPRCAGCHAAQGRWVPMSVLRFGQARKYTCPLGHPEIVLVSDQRPPTSRIVIEARAAAAAAKLMKKSE